MKSKYEHIHQSWGDKEKTSGAIKLYKRCHLLKSKSSE